MINFKENTSAERRVVGISCRGTLLCVSCLKRIDNLNRHEVQLYFTASKNVVLQFSYCQRNSFPLFIRREFCELLFDSDILNFVILCADQILETSLSLYLIVKKKKNSNLVSYHYFHELIWIRICCLICKLKAGISSQELLVNKSWFQTLKQRLFFKKKILLKFKNLSNGIQLTLDSIIYWYFSFFYLRFLFFFFFYFGIDVLLSKMK